MLRKLGAESPTLSCNTNSSEEEIKVYHHRLGRVIDGDDEEEKLLEVVPALEKREAAVSQREQELLQAIQILDQLASLDTAEYQRRLVDNSLPSIRNPHLVAKLTQSIHRFHSVVVNVTHEYDAQTTEIVQIQSQLEKSQDHIAKLETAVSKLHRRNLKYKKQSKSDKSVARKLLEQVQNLARTAAQRKEEEAFFKLATKVQHHEQVMRERCDSNFSDLGDGLQHFDDRSVASSVSTTSLVTDDGVATVKIQRERTLTWPNTEYSLDITSSMNNKNPTKQAPRPIMADSNPFAMFLTPKQAQPYTLSLIAPYYLQLCALQVILNQPMVAGETEPPPVTETAYCVCGFHNFDSSVNVKPTLGARLLEINKEPVDQSWSVQDVEQHIAAQDSNITLTFRNDRWDKAQKDALNQAVQEQLRLYPKQQSLPDTFLRKRTQSGDKPNILGFLNFHHHNSAEDDRQPARPKSATDNTAGHTSPKEDTSPLNSVMSSFWNMNVTPTKRNLDEDILFRDGEEEDLAFPLPSNEEANASRSSQELVLLLEGADAEVQNVEESNHNKNEDNTVSEDKGSIPLKTFESEPQPAASSQNKQTAEKFKSSMKNMGKIFAFR